MREWVVVVVAAAVGSVPTTSSAQQLGGQRFVPAGSEDGVLGTEGAEPRRHLFPYVTLWAHYALDPVVLRDGDGDDIGPVVEHLLGADLVASINVVAGLEFGLNVPVTLLSAGDDAVAQQAGLSDQEGAAFGDLELRAGYRFELTYRTHLALHLPVLLPTSQDDNVLALGWGVRPTLAFLQGFKQVDLVLNLSVLIRDTERALDYRGGHELGARAAIRVGLNESWDTGLLFELGFSTAFRDFFGGAVTPVEIRGGLEHWFGNHWRLTGFLGTGLSRSVGAPDLRVGAGLTFGQKPWRPRIEPLPGDRDADGILDDDDACPREPEDRDGFADEDGCPDPDNDEDGLLDEDDQCPVEPESHDGVTDEDGCPDRIRVEGTLITTFEPVHFQTDSAEILPRSHAMLREVAGVLEANPDMEIEVQGHTDSRGDDDHNMELSERRAESVRQFIIEQGIEGGRIEANGYGETRPIADDSTTEGRARNRRVEFHIQQ